MVSFEVVTRKKDETQSLGEKLGRLAEPGDVFLLTGSLGAGKTNLTQGLARGLGVKEYTRSPTFTLVNEYHGRLPLYHVDLYRIESPEEIADLGLEEYLYGRGVTVVEWADRAAFLWPHEHLLLRLEYAGHTRRRIRFEAAGSRYERLLDELEKEEDAQ